MQFKNTGLDLEKELKEKSEKDYVFGAFSLPDLSEIPEEERQDYLPEGEIQKGLEDFMDCASRGPLNILEAKFNYLINNNKLSNYSVRWLIENGYVNNGEVTLSDRFIAILSETTRIGNSLKAPLEAIRKYGLIPKSILPAERDMNFEEYHNREKITEDLLQLGRDFNDRFFINYERVDKEDFPEISKTNYINVAGYSWADPINGEYGYVNNPPNHVFAIFKRIYYIFDNYLDFDEDFIKKLTPDYNFYKYGYKITVNENPVKPEKRNLYQRFISYIKKWFIYF